ncbi:MAG: hypothetical protein ACRESS_01360, partial [Stenotrophobium sp.]
MKTQIRTLAKIILLSTGGLAAGLAQAGSTDLANQPLFTSQPVAGNLMLDLSVEYPTADSAAYPTANSTGGSLTTFAYSTSNEYVGYFDPNKCYTYTGGSGTTASGDSEVAANNSSTLNQGYFKPTAVATAHACSGQ